MSGGNDPIIAGSEQTAPGPSRPSRRRQWLITVGAVVASAVGGAAAFSALSSSSPSSSPDAHAAHHRLESLSRPITREQLAGDYGIRLTLVGVTAAGGLVDLRFKITDAKKARKLFDDPAVMPAIVAEPTGVILAPPHGGHHSHVTPTSGASYFVLIGNAGGVVQRGVPVSVVINSVRVEHILAET
jgi:hypothetical protein